MPDRYKLLFEVTEEKEILVWINSMISLSFKDMHEYKKFLDDMSGMIPEITSSYGLID